jgi:hypothetical protein
LKFPRETPDPSWGIVYFRIEKDRDLSTLFLSVRAYSLGLIVLEVLVSICVYRSGYSIDELVDVGLVFLQKLAPAIEVVLDSE